MPSYKATLLALSKGLVLDPLPPRRLRDDLFPHAPIRKHSLNKEQMQLAVKNALRYFPPYLHDELSFDFSEELKNYGHIYMYRFLPQFQLKAYPIQDFPAKCNQAAAIMLMICNNLDPAVAQFPQELVTYGGNGQVFSNWAQFWIVMKYLSEMTEQQTLVLYSGHPLGLFPSKPELPRVVITNGMVIPNYSSQEQYENLFAQGVTMYGQMTAGSYCYIGPQGIVHGTTLTVMNAGRKYLGVNDLSGLVFVTSGLGGMSGAQAKAAVISGCIGVIAEVSYEALKKRYEQGWLNEIESDLDKLVAKIKTAKTKKEAKSIGYHGNVVDLWERLTEEWEKTHELLVDLGSDQTSCHNVFSGGYYPVQLTFSEAQKVLSEDPERFKGLVRQSLLRHINAINALAKAGMHFWDYGNAFLLQASRAGADVGRIGTSLRFRYPSYMQDIMGDIFSLGFGPFRWICTSGLPEDLQITDNIATGVIEELLKEDVEQVIKNQYVDNLKWIKEAEKHNLVVGSQARILYSDRKGRIRIAQSLNNAIAEKKIKGPVVISRDHHDVSGTDSPFRETSNIEDGSAFTADMAVQNFIGTGMRGATWVALHNGGGVGWGEVINGGFGLVLDGSQLAEECAKLLLGWDVANGIARRCWSGNDNAYLAIHNAMKEDHLLKVTMPFNVINNNVLDKF
ncbi:urocanate hydratase-like [Lycorma delicatula]|uniref:urocanate hydratase-like n=1 Tax=Lycorma delicatula TaxID=130591 RepID=UPI003F511D05